MNAPLINDVFKRIIKIPHLLYWLLLSNVVASTLFPMKTSPQLMKKRKID